MNKKQLIARVRRYMGPGATRSTASASVEAVLHSIIRASTDAKGVHITRFGTFRCKTKTNGDKKLAFSPSRYFSTEIPEKKDKP